MRLWHYELIKVLPKQMLLSQWREIIAIKRQWEKGTLKHGLVNYVKQNDKAYFLSYTVRVVCELINRGVIYNEKLYYEIVDFCKCTEQPLNIMYDYKEHDDVYLRECLYNLEEKARRGIISKEEWEKIYNKFSSKYDLCKIK